jgi:TonB family protein
MRYFLLRVGSLLLLTIVGFGQDNPQVLKPVKPDFPADALAKTIGKERIDLFLDVDKNGHVKGVEGFGPWLTCGKSDDVANALRKAAVDAAEKVVFAPVIKDGKPSEGVATISYSLEGTEPPSTSDHMPSLRGAVVNGKSISKPVPKYPSKARKLGVQGSVTIWVVIDEEGSVISARAKSGHPLLLANAAEAACQAHWTPTTLAGQPVKVSAAIVYNFMP